MASSRYGIPNYDAVSDADVDHLLEQFEDETLLNLRLGSHRPGSSGFEAFAEVSKSTPSYLQDEYGGLDEDLAARLAALKASKIINPQGKSGASVDSPPLKTAGSRGASVQPLPEGSKHEAESKTQLGVGGKAGVDAQKGVSASGAVNEHAEPDPDDVTSLGDELARRLGKLKGGGKKESSQRGRLDSDGAKSEASAAERFASLQKCTLGDLADNDIAASQDSVRTGATPVHAEVSKSFGTPFVDLSRGGGRRQPVEMTRRNRAKESWSNPWAGLFGQRRSSDKAGRGPDTQESPEVTERRAHEVLAWFSKNEEGASRSGSSRSRSKRQPAYGATSMDSSSKLFQDLQAVQAPQAEGVYDEVLRDEQRERSEVEALIAAMHDDVRIKNVRRPLGVEDAGCSEEEEEVSSAASGSDTEVPEKRRVDEVAAWAVDAARLEVLDSGKTGAARKVSSRRHRHESSDEESDMSSGKSSGESDSPGFKGRKVASKKGQGNRRS